MDIEVLLQAFFEDARTREAVKLFITEKLKEEAVSAVFKKQSAAGLYEANRAVERAFEELADRFGKKKEEKKVEHNSAR